MSDDTRYTMRMRPKPLDGTMKLEWVEVDVTDRINEMHAEIERLRKENADLRNQTIPVHAVIAALIEALILRAIDAALCDDEESIDSILNYVTGTAECAEIRGLFAELDAENERLRKELSDIKDAHQTVMSERCPEDEKHCACVPTLRAEIKRLRDSAHAKHVWPSCGHNSFGVCSICYHDRGEYLSLIESKLSVAKAEIEQLRAERDLWRRRYERLDPKPGSEAAERAAEVQK